LLHRAPEQSINVIPRKKIDSPEAELPFICRS